MQMEDVAAAILVEKKSTQRHPPPLPGVAALLAQNDSAVLIVATRCHYLLQSPLD